jgi:hypothetical protein
MINERTEINHFLTSRSLYVGVKKKLEIEPKNPFASGSFDYGLEASLLSLVSFPCYFYFGCYFSF